MKTAKTVTALLLTVLTTAGLLATGSLSTASAAPVTGTHRYLVSTTSPAVADGLSVRVRRSGGTVSHVYSRVFSGFSATLTAAQAQALARDDRVASVVPDQLVHTTGVESDPTWGLDRIDQRSTTGDRSYSYGTGGTGVTAFVLDTGIRFGHSQFGGRASSGPDFVDQDYDAADCSGHGTHVAGTIGGSTFGVAKGVRLVSVRALDCSGVGSWGDVIAGLDWIVANRPAGPAVVNLSVSGSAFPLVDQAVERTVAAGVPVVVAAGNAGSDACDQSPGRAPSAITVAATDASDTRASWSDTGSCVDLFAPGVDVRSASIASDTSSVLMSGTSMAAPHVTGVVARYLQSHPRATPGQVSAGVLGASTRGKVKDAQGSPDRLVFVAPPGSVTVTTRRGVTG